MQQQHATPTTTITDQLRISTGAGGVHDAAIVATCVRAHIKGRTRKELQLWWLSPAATSDGGVSHSDVGTTTPLAPAVVSPIATFLFHPLALIPALHSGILHCVVVVFGGGGRCMCMWWWWLNLRGGGVG